MKPVLASVYNLACQVLIVWTLPGIVKDRLNHKIVSLPREPRVFQKIAVFFQQFVCNKLKGCCEERTRKTDEAVPKVKIREKWLLNLWSRELGLLNGKFNWAKFKI